jgi:hypothetical protein
MLKGRVVLLVVFERLCNTQSDGVTLNSIAFALVRKRGFRTTLGQRPNHPKSDVG